MTSFVLKIIAMVTMIIDHITYCFVPYDTIWYTIGRTVGRIAFPLFCFMVVEGFYRTKCLWKYMLRLGIFALLSEVPFDMAFKSMYFDLSYQNVLLTLLLGLFAIALIDFIKQRFYPTQVWIYTLLTIPVIFFFGYAGEFLNTDYGMFGVVVIITMYFLRTNKLLMTISFPLLCFFAYGSSMINEVAGTIAFIFIFLYNGKKGPSDHKLFYLIYPAHLLILGLIVMSKTGI